MFRQHLIHPHAEADLDLLPGLGEHAPQDLHVAVRAQVAHLGVQQVEVVAQAGRFQVGACGGIEPRLGPAQRAEHGIHVFHQLHGLLHAYVFVQIAPEFGGDVVFAVGQGARAAVALHDVAGLAADAFRDLARLDGADALLQGAAFLQHQHPGGRVPFSQLVGGESAGRARAHDDDIVILHITSLGRPRPERPAALRAFSHNI